MNLAFIGCGYVFDIYMRSHWAHAELVILGVYDIDRARSQVVHKHYGLKVYDDAESLLADPNVDIVVNLTSIGSHYAVTNQALDAGKHVYSEKPLSLSLEQTTFLYRKAKSLGQTLVCAPCNHYSDSIVSISKALSAGAIGRPVLVYAELDDNPAHLMNLEKVRSPTGAPFPYAEELQEGCTVEHVGYHLVWLCAHFGPVISLTAYSRCLVPNKTAEALSPPDTPDFSVACLTFSGGVTARVTCSWVAPRDHSFRIIGEAGQVSCDNIFHDQSPVWIERFSRVSLTARKAYSLRRHPFFGRLLGIGGRRAALVRRWKSHAVEDERGVGRSLKHRIVSKIRRREVYAQDKFLGLAEMAQTIAKGEGGLYDDLYIHLNELTLLIARAGENGLAVVPSTSFEHSRLPQISFSKSPNYEDAAKPRLAERMMAKLLR